MVLASTKTPAGGNGPCSDDGDRMIGSEGIVGDSFWTSCPVQRGGTSRAESGHPSARERLKCGDLRSVNVALHTFIGAPDSTRPNDDDTSQLSASSVCT